MIKRNSIVSGRLAAATLVLAAILVPSLVLSACRIGPSEPFASVTVAVPRLEQNALLYVAEAQQLFEHNGLHVTLQDYDTGVAAMKALLSGSADIAELAEVPVIKPVLEGQPLRILAVNDRFESGYLVVKNRVITSPADLKGKKIGVIRGTILEFYLGRFLQLHGIQRDDVTIVDTEDTTRTIDSIVSGELDAVAAFQPHVVSIQDRLGDEVTTWPAQNGQLAYGILVSNAHWLSGNSDTVERFLKALAGAESYAAAHPQEAMSIVQNRLNLDPDYVASIWPLHQFSLSLDFSLIVAMNDEARWMMDHNLVARQPVPDFKVYVYLDGLKAIKPGAVNIIR